MSGRYRQSWSRLWATSLVAVGGVLASPGCPARMPVSEGPSRPAAKVTVRDIRVRLDGDATRLRLRVNGPYQVRSGTATLWEAPSLEWTEIVGSADGRIRFGDRELTVNGLEVVPARSGDLYWCADTGKGWGPSGRLGGRMRITSNPLGRLTAINHVDLETYLIGVLVGELYADFHPQAFNAAAVAARTYAMVEMSKHGRDEYDVTATEASQVYVGIPDGPAAKTAQQAVQYTRGVVCTWESPHGKRIFPTYYSSACGGMTQAASNCKPEENVPPLRGGVRCDYCRIAPGEAYRWKPVKISKSELFSKVVQRYPEFASLRSLRSLLVVTRASTGRPIQLRLVGDNGQTRDLLAENFRLAVGSRTLRSTDCRMADVGSAIVFSDGKGFGHGMGLCQWGMQGQALAGKHAAQILKFYYPDVKLVRAY